MISIMKKQRIILDYFTKGFNKTEITTKTGVDWKTVNKYIKEYEEAKHSLVEEKGSKEVLEIIEEITNSPTYDSSTRKKRKITHEIIEEVEKCLLANKIKRENGQKKQQMSAPRKANIIKLDNPTHAKSSHQHVTDSCV